MGHHDESRAIGSLIGLVALVAGGLGFVAGGFTEEQRCNEHRASMLEERATWAEAWCPDGTYYMAEPGFELTPYTIVCLQPVVP